MELYRLIEKTVEDTFDSMEILKRARGIVVSVDSDNSYADMKVNGVVIRMVNKTGEELAVGDTATIHYWTYIRDGYIAIRHGETVLLG